MLRRYGQTLFAALTRSDDSGKVRSRTPARSQHAVREFLAEGVESTKRRR